MAKKKTLSPEKQQRLLELEHIDAEFSQTVARYVNDLYMGEWRLVIEKIVSEFGIQSSHDWALELDAVACAVLSEMIGYEFDILSLKKSDATKVLRAFREKLAIDLAASYSWAYYSPLHEFVREFGTQIRAQMNGEATWELR